MYAPSGRAFSSAATAGLRGTARSRSSVPRLPSPRRYSQAPPGPRIAIIGAGPAGLTLARLLQHQTNLSSASGLPRPEISIYDLDPSPQARDQGGSLDLHPTSGQLALKRCGLYDKFQELARPEGEVLKIYLPDGRLIMDEGSNPEEEGRPKEMHDRPEIDRRALRSMLLESLEPGTVRWGKKLKEVVTRSVAVDEGKNREVFDLRFDEQTAPDETGFDMVVGADGAWSRVRRLLTPVAPFFSGIAGLDVRLTEADTAHPAQAARCGLGMCLTLGPNRGVLSQRSGPGPGEVRTYAFVRMAAEGFGEDWMDKVGIDWSNMKTAIPAFMDRFYSGWDEGARNMVLRADSSIALPRNMWMLPPGLRWETRPGVTLLGDAAHLMTPFAGVGVNVAMQDSLVLAQSILTHLGYPSIYPGPSSAVPSSTSSTVSPTYDLSMAAAIKEYEAEMLPRAEQFAQQTLMYLDLFFHKRGGLAMVEHFDRVKEEERKEGTEQTPSATGSTA